MDVNRYMDESPKHCEKQKKPDTEKFILCDSTDMMSQNRQNSTTVIKMGTALVYAA